MTGWEVVDRYETPQSTAAAAHFDMGSTTRISGWSALSSAIVDSPKDKNNEFLIYTVHPQLRVTDTRLK